MDITISHAAEHREHPYNNEKARTFFSAKRRKTNTPSTMPRVLKKGGTSPHVGDGCVRTISSSARGRWHKWKSGFGIRFETTRKSPIFSAGFRGSKWGGLTAKVYNVKVSKPKWGSMLSMVAGSRRKRNFGVKTLTNFNKGKGLEDLQDKKNKEIKVDDYEDPSHSSIAPRSSALPTPRSCSSNLEM